MIPKKKKKVTKKSPGLLRVEEAARVAGTRRKRSQQARATGKPYTTSADRSRQRSTPDMAPRGSRSNPATKPAKPKRRKLKDMPPLQRMDEADRRSHRVDRRANRNYRSMENLDANSKDAEGGLKRTGGDQKVPPRNAPFYQGRGVGRAHNLTYAEAYEQAEKKARKAEARRNKLRKIARTGEMPKKKKKKKKS